MARKRYMHRKVQVTWYGDDFLDIVTKYGDEALFAAGQVVLDEATRRAPRGRTGNLRKSAYISTASRTSYVRRRYWRKEKKPPTSAATVGFSAPHAHLIESGRRKAGKMFPKRRKALKIGERFVSRSRFRRMSSKPFLGPAIEATKATMVEELADVLRSKLEKFLGRFR